MNQWVFKCYISEQEKDVMGHWYNDLPVKAQAKFDTILEYLRDTPHNEWGNNICKPVTGYKGIFEIRFQVRNVLYRPLGFFGKGHHEFIFVNPAREQGDEFIPRNAPEIAVERMKKILTNEATSHECCF